MIFDRFFFFVSGQENEVSPDSGLWQYPLSGKPTESEPPPSQSSELTIGDYFTAAARFLLQDDFLILRTGLESVLKQKVQNEEILSIHLSLEKHGAFYHPLKLSVHVHDCKVVYFVLNGAVSSDGLSLVESEYGSLSFLYDKFKSNQFLPRVFASKIIQTDKGPVGFFMGQWFEGFKEFHITRNKGEKKLVIWNSDGTCSYLSFSRALPIYREIARILTCLYDMETFEQVFPWHHAAGDFIVKPDAGMQQVRLITVRGYAPLIGFDPAQKDSTEHILPSLLLFFIHLSVRIRLDRFDGTGSLALLDDRVVLETTKGFLEALDEKSIHSDYKDISRSFIVFYRQFDRDQLTGVVENILNSYCSQVEEIELIRKNLDSHCRILHSIFKNA